MSSGYINIPSFGAMEWKSPVATSAALPSTGNSSGDVRAVLNTDSLYIWSGSAWVFLVSPGATPLTMGAFGSTPNAEGGTISGGVLTLQPADETHPGGISIGSQAFLGAKEFRDSVVLGGGATINVSLSLNCNGQVDSNVMVWNLDSGIGFGPEFAEGGLTSRPVFLPHYGGTDATVNTPEDTVIAGNAGPTYIRATKGGDATAINNIDGYDTIAGNGGDVVVQGGYGGSATSDNGALTQGGSGGNVYIYPGLASGGDAGTVYVGNGSDTVSLNSGGLTLNGSVSAYFGAHASFGGGVTFTTALDMSSQSIQNVDGLYTYGIYAVGTVGPPVIVPGSTTLYDGSGTATVDWGNQQLVSGNAIRVDWGSQQLKDSSGIVCIDWTLRQIKNSTGANIAGWNVGGVAFNISTPGASTKGLSILASASQTANLQEWQNSSGTALASVDKDGSAKVAGFAAAIVSKSANYTATSADHTILVDASGAARTITLPAASGASGRIYVIKKTDSSANTVTIDANASETIDGALTQVISTQYVALMIQCNGTSWWII